MLSLSFVKRVTIWRMILLHLDPTAGWLSPLALAIYMFVVNFDALAQASDFSNRKKTSCLPLLNAGFEHRVSETESPAEWVPAEKPSELSKVKLKKLNSTARPYDQSAFSPLNCTAGWLSHLTLAIYMLVVNFDALAQASDFQIKEDKLSSSAECRIRTQGLWNRVSSRLSACWKIVRAIEDQA